MHILWDWNGTILDDSALCVEILNILCRRRNLPEVTQEKYATDFKFPVIKFYEDVGFDFTKEKFEDVTYEFTTIYEKRKMECNLRPGVMSIIEELNNLGVPQSVLSAYSLDLLEDSLSFHNITHHFKEINGAGDKFSRGKKELAKAVRERNNFLNGQTLYVGDTTHDFEAAAILGGKCALVLSGHNTLERLTSVTKNVFTDSSTLRNYIFRECQLSA